ncbi:MAG: carboxypeptidase regulatory-like domain-containing protein [Bryobacteraceae bacterium]
MRPLSGILAFAAFLLNSSALCQETRSTIFGRVLDPQGVAVHQASVTITNLETNTSVVSVTNETGYYEVSLLLPGAYRVSAAVSGFRTSVREGISLLMDSRAQVDLKLELGAVTDSITVTAAAPLLDTSSGSSGRVLDSRTQMGLPASAGSTLILAVFAPGVQTSGEVQAVSPQGQGSASNYQVNGGVGGNEWALDGAPNMGINRSVAYVPHSDTISEMKMETSGFDAAIGHTTGVMVNLLSKTGTNRYHGSVSDIHVQDRWNAMNFFERQLYYRNLAAAEASGNTALAQSLRNSPRQPSGHRNQYMATLAGPLIIPKVYNGRDKLFFFFNAGGFRIITSANPEYQNKTFPTMAHRAGDFSSLLQVDSVRYQIYDPLSVRPDPARAGHYIRDPIPGNILPSSRMVNPVYEFYRKLPAPPNRDPLDPRMEPANNYLASDMPQRPNYDVYGARFDYHHSSKHRFFVRYTWDEWTSYINDWTYNTYPGLMATGPMRRNNGGIVDWTWVASARTMFDFSIGIHQYSQGNKREMIMDFKPSDVGLPKYLDEKAGSQHILPSMTITGYRFQNAVMGNNVGTMVLPATQTTKADVSHVRGRHSLHAGVDIRNQYRSGGGGGFTSGNFTFNNFYTRRNDDTLTPAGDLGHSWAAFMMGLPTTSVVETNDTHITHNMYFAWFVQDNWRITPKLNLNFGLRAEYEQGQTERYNRMIGPFDPSATLPIAAAAQAAYAAKPVPERAAADFVVRGGSTYPGSGGRPRNILQNALMWLPRASAAYQVGRSTVIRAGYGMFYDTMNVLYMAPNQLGFSRDTTVVASNDFGMTWNAGNPRAGVSPLTDPFPVRVTGDRFDLPVRDALGVMAVAGASSSSIAFNTPHPRLQRWRAGVQHQLTPNMMVEAAYAGSYASRVGVSKNVDALPEQYWAGGLVRNNALATNLNSNVTNPFALANFSALRTGSPLVYQDMSSKAFFTSATIRKNLLLRPYPHMNGVTQANMPVGEMKTHQFEAVFERRFSQGFNLYAAYTRLYNRGSDYFYNEWDTAPSWRESNNGRPHRLAATGIWELPFGRGRALLKSGPLNVLLGGFQVALRYELQPGPLIDFGNLFYYGNLEDITSGERTFSRWFNTANFERTSSKTPAAFHRRVFPTRIDGLRADCTNIWSGNAQRDFRITERFTFRFRVDILNLANRTQFDAPDVSPVSSTFGAVTAQSLTVKRWMQFTLRVAF